MWRKGNNGLIHSRIATREFEMSADETQSLSAAEAAVRLVRTYVESFSDYKKKGNF
jgi:hypothetical protein